MTENVGARIIRRTRVLKPGPALSPADNAVSGHLTFAILRIMNDENVRTISKEREKKKETSETIRHRLMRGEQFSSWKMVAADFSFPTTCIFSSLHLISASSVRKRRLTAFHQWLARLTWISLHNFRDPITKPFRFLRICSVQFGNARVVWPRLHRCARALVTATLRCRCR